MARMSKQTEEKLLGYSKKVAEHVGSGMTPNDAIVKVARDMSVEPGHIQLLVQAFNNTRFDQQRRNGESLFDKIANFPVADPKAILKELYPSNIKEAEARHRRETVVSPEYSQPPVSVRVSPFAGLEKVASVTRPDPRLSNVPAEKRTLLKRATGALEELNHEFEERRRLLGDCHDKVASLYKELTAYFKGVGHPITFKEARINSVALYGVKAGRIFDAIEQDNPHFAKQASCRLLVSVDHKKAPFNLVEQILDKSAEYIERRDALRAFQKEAVHSSQQLLGLIMGRTKKAATNGFFKCSKDKDEEPADLAGGAIKQLGGAVSSLTPSSDVLSTLLPKPTSSLKGDAFMSVNDPLHAGQLRGIKAKAMLANLMNTDPHISAEPPGKVVNLFNSLSQLTPRAGDKKLVTQGLLRRFLAQGQVDPHEADQALGMEQKIKQQGEQADRFELPKLPGDFSGAK